MDSSQDFPPPVMRQDLSIFPDEADEEGAPQWVMHDPLCNRFFSIRQNEVELLPFINGDSIDNIIINAREILKRIFGKQEVEALFNFLRVNNLVVGDAHQQAWYRRQRTAKPSVFARLARSYLFFRIPLWRPENFLEKTAPFVSVLTQKKIQVVIAILGFAGLFLVTRQFDRFLATFPYLFNLQGIFLFATSLMFVKILHELGHAYSAKFQGCKVPVIGVAILLGRPVLYTDTSDVWRLASRNARLEITAAGIKVEFAVAALALFAWNFTSDGILCTIFFLLATTTWITSVFINFNPFLRYDGYYLLSDLWRIPNLEQRAFAMAKWFIHNKILGLEGEPPEPFKIRLVVFAFSAWIYRFLLFLGIALLVYHFFFKLLGIFLFVIEIAYFIVRPVYNEISSYYKLRDQLRWNRTLIRTLLICFFVLGFCFFPWSRTIHLPAVFEQQYTKIYSPLSSRIREINITNGDKVNGGELLVELESPRLDYEIRQINLQLDELDRQKEAIDVDPAMRDQSMIIKTKIKTEVNKLHGVINHKKRLELFAPHGGEVVNLQPDLSKEEWLQKGELLFAIKGNSSPGITGFIEETELLRVRSGMSGQFFPEKGNWKPFKVIVQEIEVIGVRTISSPYMVSQFGGDVATRKDNNGNHIPIKGVYRVFMKNDLPMHPMPHVIRGEVVLKGDRKSLLAGLWRRAIALFLRETGF